MKRKRLKKIISLVIVATLSAMIFVGCGDSKKESGEDEQVLTYNLGADSKTLDPALNSSVDGGIVLSNAFEGLCRTDENDKAIEGGAESWTISDDQLTYTFKLREDAKWSNGDSVTAEDYEYAWKRVLNPETAAEYAYQMYYIKGAEAYNTGSGSVDDVGVKAIDDYTLEVQLESPTTYFLELTAFPCYFPVNKKVVEADPDWATKVDTYVSNGPFELTDWKLKDSLVFEKNQDYYDKDKVKLDKLIMKMVTDETSASASYKSGDFDMIDVVPISEIETGLADGSYTKFPNLGTYYLSINVTGENESDDVNKALQNEKVRKALSLAIDRDSIVKNITKGGEIPAYSFVPEGIPGADGNDFASKEYFKTSGNIDEAKKLLEEAGYKDGEGFPTITLLYNQEGAHGDIMQAIADMWKKNLGINVSLAQQEWKVFQTTRTDKNYNIARDGWLGDYVDPMTFLDLFTSTSSLNNSGFSNSEYDSLISEAKAETDSAKRDEILHKAEDILMDDMSIIPIYYYSQVKGIKSYVKDVRVSALGFVYFDRAYIDGK
ncbi:Oligopeptide ABC transporter, periplasmic oligopeptide-binding protein [Clostridium bornimense]|uniref:Oligopeptide ABC transporter, periplasmic oligopeptide-binding protein n=1 Tax=Clostridium bornimense TaxID=1216932 RepID=W6S4K2_9CLOT|nr:peptide ABC transporter substrate-binding protein [Clostridium bornimense]CDM69272.1 Oligopeptide ABC transporter, periplasmic oligopeptide-binding protein [Clostridium bornimense]